MWVIVSVPYERGIGYKARRCSIAFKAMAVSVPYERGIGYKVDLESRDWDFILVVSVPYERGIGYKAQ